MKTTLLLGEGSDGKKVYSTEAVEQPKSSIERTYQRVQLRVREEETRRRAGISNYRIFP